MSIVRKSQKKIKKKPIFHFTSFEVSRKTALTLTAKTLYANNEVIYKKIEILLLFYFDVFTYCIALNNKDARSNLFTVC